MKVKQVRNDMIVDGLRIIDAYKLLYNACVAKQLDMALKDWIQSHPWGNGILWKKQ